MRPKRKPFILVKHKGKNGEFTWYARFWDAEKQAHTITRSTGVKVEGKRERKEDARAAARGLQKDIHFTPTVEDLPFVEYLENFWTENSAYVKERALILKHPLSTAYVNMNHDDVARHVRPYAPFKRLALKDLKPAIIRDWMSWAAEQGMSGRRINAVLQSMRVSVRYAIEREELFRDPFLKVKPAHDEPKEKGVLTPTEVEKIIALKASDPSALLCVYLGALCGLRRGEVRGLQWGDVDLAKKMINIKHNFVEVDGLKDPKKGSVRSVPMLAVVKDAFKAMEKLAPWKDSDDYVIFKLKERHVPVSETYIKNRFDTILDAIGIGADERKRRQLTFHGLRHTYVTLGRLSGLSDMVIQALAGHRSASMMERYSHANQVIDFNDARAKIEKAVNQ